MENRKLSLEAEVFQSLADMSNCWNPKPDTQTFDSKKATKIGNDIVGKIENDLPNAIKVLQKHLKGDKSEGSYYHSWVCNIAMAFKDEYDRTPDVFKSDIHTIANEAAKNFLNLLISK